MIKIREIISFFYLFKKKNIYVFLKFNKKKIILKISKNVGFLISNIILLKSKIKYTESLNYGTCNLFISNSIIALGSFL
jgi:hypothetical protein